MSMKALNERLKEQNVRYTIIDGEEYFYVEDIQKNYDYMIVDLKEVIYVDEIPLIKVKFINKLSKFDKMMKQTLNFKPKDKEN
ncbi:hypothetical protein CMU76_17265 [Elizabethkingia anophelis]|nr:hypothetical protein [Elizabethkingia anophelis]